MKFSVIVPAYKVGRYLRECLKSVANQTYEDWECICVDDGSPDDTGKIIDEFAARDKRFVAVHQQNAGVGAARNAGLRRALGEWVCLLDSDDVWHQSLLQFCADVIAANPQVDMVGFGNEVFYDDNYPCWRAVGGELATTGVRDVSKTLAYADIRRAMWGWVYKRNVLPPGLFPTYRTGEDLTFLTGALMRAQKVAVMDAALYGYRQRGGSFVHTGTKPEGLLERMSFFEEWISILDATKKRIDKAVLRSAALGATEHLVYDFARFGDCRCRLAWEKWYEMLVGFPPRQLDAMPMWNQFVIRICRAVRSRTLAKILCALPFWLKKHGVNRHRKS